MTLESKLLELKDEYKILNLSIQDNNIVMTINDINFGVMKNGEPDIKILKLGKAFVYFNQFEKELIKRGHYGKYAIVYPEGEVEIAITQSDAFNHVKPDQLCHIACIGGEGPDLLYNENDAKR